MQQNIPLLGLIFIAVNLIISQRGIKDDIFFNKYQFEIRKIRQGEYYRLISAGFLHVNFTHLLFNMLTLYFFMSFVFSALGQIIFSLLYVGSLIIGNLFAYIFHYNQYSYTAVGASGAVTGVLFSSLLLYPNIELMLFFIPIPIPGYLFGIAYMIYTLYGMKTQNDSIGHTAHFGGALGGVLVTIIFNYQVIYTSQLMLGTLSIIIFITGYMLYLKKRK